MEDDDDFSDDDISEDVIQDIIENNKDDDKEEYVNGELKDVTARRVRQR